ncbi:MAG: flagellar basal body rod protein FlgC [Pseudomonadota bacterium]
MALFDVFDIAGTGMRAQSLRLNVTSSNLANAENVATRPEDAYRARHPIFASFMTGNDFGAAGTFVTPGATGGAESTGVRVLGIVESSAPPVRRYEPDHPQADEDGYIYATNVNPIEEMVNMLSASRSYQSNVEVLNTTKDLLLGTLRLGQ